MTTLNKDQVDALFRREAVLIGTEDQVPEPRVSALFGADAAEFAKTTKDRQYYNGFGVGNCTIMYITYRGFLAAATYYNAQQLREEAGA